MKSKIVSFFSAKNLRIYLNDDKDKEDLWFDFMILSLIFLSCIIFILETATIFQEYDLYLFYADYILNIIFTLEIFLRVYFSNNLKKHFKSSYTYIDLFAILPFWLGLGSYTFFRAFRLFRIFRIVRFLRYSSKYLSATENEINSTIEKIFVFRILLSLFLFLYITSAIFFQFENGINPNINNFWDSVYFVVVSITTVGFGDIIPYTKIGRAIIMLGVIGGFVILPWHLSSLSSVRS